MPSKQARGASNVVSLADLALARYRYTRAVVADDRDDSKAKREAEEERRQQFADLKAAFESASGALVRERWGTYIPVALVITERRAPRPFRWLGFYSRFTLHRSTAFVAMPPEIDVAFADGDALAAEITGVLRGAPQRAMLERLGAAQAYLLAAVDSSARPDASDPLKHPEVHHQELLQHVRDDYKAASRRRAQFIYMQGAFAGLVVLLPLLLVAGLLAWAFGYSVLERTEVVAAFGCALAGGFGAAASVSWRLSLFQGFDIDPGASVLVLRSLGMTRSWIGAVFGLALFFALKGNFINVGQKGQNFYYFAFFSFVAGFSERMIPDLTRAAEQAVPDDVGTDADADWDGSQRGRIQRTRERLRIRG